MFKPLKFLRSINSLKFLRFINRLKRVKFINYVTFIKFLSLKKSIIRLEQTKVSYLTDPYLPYVGRTQALAHIFRCHIKWKFRVFTTLEQRCCSDRSSVLGLLKPCLLPQWLAYPVRSGESVPVICHHPTIQYCPQAYNHESGSVGSLRLQIFNPR